MEEVPADKKGLEWGGDHTDRSSRRGWGAEGQGWPWAGEDSAAPPTAEESQMLRCKFCPPFRAELLWSNH